MPTIALDITSDCDGIAYVDVFCHDKCIADRPAKHITTSNNIKLKGKVTKRVTVTSVFPNRQQEGQTAGLTVREGRGLEYRWLGAFDCISPCCRMNCALS